VKAGNVDAVVALYAPDAVLYPPDALEARGTAAIRASYESMLSAVVVNEASIDSQYQTSGDMSVGFGKATLTMTPKAGGSPQIMSVRVTAVARKIGGKWLYVVDHASAPLPPPPPPKP
jgi:ketosteroid isomerase-like protein